MCSFHAQTCYDKRKLFSQKAHERPEMKSSFPKLHLNRRDWVEGSVSLQALEASQSSFEDISNRNQLEKNKKEGRKKCEKCKMCRDE